MGADGGSIPTRVDMVKTRQVERKVQKEDSREAFERCALSKQPLESPVVICELGRLYNKQELIAFLLDLKRKAKENTEDDAPDVSARLPHIKSLKDVFDVKTTFPLRCPITQVEPGDSHTFLYVRGCGCVLSKRALGQVQSQGSQGCLNCGIVSHELEEERYIVIAPSNPPDVAAAHRIMNARKTRRAQENGSKNSKKRKKLEFELAPELKKAKELKN
jgi:hypothetical protein